MILPVGTLLLTRKQKVEHLLVTPMRDIEWFRPPGHTFHQDTFGSFQGTYKLTRKLMLLNLGNETVRTLILDSTDLNPVDFNPDIQYSSYADNLKVHEAIQASPFLKRYDGTIITSKLTDPALTDELAGPEEIVLFTNRTNGKLTLNKIETINTA